MEGVFNTILVSLSKGNFLETDGISYWWVEEGKYHSIYEKTFKSFITKKLVYSKRIDDETTCYYLSSDKINVGEYSPEFLQEQSVENARKEYAIRQIRSFINL